ncbi:unnamed protein product [Sphagnum troendelagicum]|uniref:V-SNARE coiled-coil homology domain-containing protein n=1 Tax=Sphagnum troendelagicum TaxID=128251 RepID=A0ABP0TAM0_9BRYO
MFPRRFFQKNTRVSSAVAEPDVSPEIAVSVGRLSKEDLQPRLSVHQGIPATASILAFEPVQRVLAVASLDGRIKLFGLPGLEILLQSPTPAPCKFLKFMNNGEQLVQITTQNNIEIWNLEKQELACSLKWEHDITAIATLQGTPYMYIGDENGTVSVLQCEDSGQQATQMAYCIPAHITLVKAGSSTAPSVVGILPQPHAAYSRVVIAYANGLIVLWGLHETQVLAVRGGTAVQRKQLAEYSTKLERTRSIAERVMEQAVTLGEQFTSSSSSKSSTLEEEDEEEKEICTVCWACSRGNVLAAGYVDGEIWLWSIPLVSKERGQGEQNDPHPPTSSGIPLRKLDLAPGKAMKMPVILLSWCGSSKTCKGGSGRLHVYGGHDLGSPQSLMVLSLEGESSDELKPLELSLHGPFADMVLLPSAGGDLNTPAAALLVLTSPGLLHIYDGAGIDSFFNAATEDGCSPSSLQPVPWQSPTTAEVVAVKLITVSRLAAAANVLIQLTQNHKVLPYALPAGTRWPITGGVASRVTSSGDQGKKMNILLTGHKTGIIQVWDASSPTIQHICTVEAQNKDNPAPVNVMDFCGESGLLAVGDQQGKVHVFRLNAQAQEVKCYKITSGTPTEEVFNTAAGFQCIAALTVHLAAIQTVVVTHDPARLAVGDESGMVSLLDLGTCSLLFYCNFFESNLSITSLVVTSTQSSNESMHTTSPPSSPSTSQKQPIPPSFTTMVYAANKNGAVVVLDGSTGGHLAGPLQPQNSSVTVSMHILDASGAVTQVVSCKEHAEEDQSKPQLVPVGTDNLYLLICSEKSLRLYSSSAVMQGSGDTLQEVELQTPCGWAATFKVPSTNASSLVLLNQSGWLEIRSLPDLGILYETTLSSCLSWQLELSSNFWRTLACAENGHLLLIDEGRELIQLSLLKEETELRLPQCLPHIYDKDLAAAAEAAMKYAMSQPKKSQTQGLLGVLMEFKSSLEQGPAVHSASELPKLLSSQPFTIPSVLPSDLGSPSDSSALDTDINLEIGIAPRHFSDIIPTSAVSKETSDVEDDRRQLLGDDNKPRQRTTDEIKAAYGHAKALDASSAAGLARDKLMERGQKLQSINQRTEEMQAGAEDFASMAEQLAKKMERRKWWEF